MPSASLPPTRRYLWAQGNLPTPLTSKTMLAGRYQVLQYPLIQDMAPDEPPTPLGDVPPLAEPYLYLSRFTVAIPRPFTQVMAPDGQTPLLLLEDIPLRTAAPATELPPLLPPLPDGWSQATALQQLCWLRQLAKLWRPLQEHQVSASILDWQNIRVDGEDVRLLQLTPQESTPALAELGTLWQPLAAIAAPAIRDYLVELTALLADGQGSPEGLVNSLSEALEQLTQSPSIQVQLATYSDQGPARQRNEDACYPQSGFAAQAAVQVATVDQAAAPLVVVCDGVGGHEGGDVASQLAIAEVTRRLAPITATANLPNRQVVTALKDAIRAANQVISDRNDADHREDRNRMGTTLVMALVYGARVYIAHLGDSRAYRVRADNCRQITLDDDVAAREMRLGLELYQDALQNPGAGALVQALGMAHSDHLRPTVTLYPIATDSLFLLCSDGLSDHELVPRLWQSELRPVLTGDRDVATAGQRLIDLANTHNGHDNVTVALLRLCPQVVDRAVSPVPIATTQPLLATPHPPTTQPPGHAGTAKSAETSVLSAPVPASRASKVSPIPLIVSSVLIAGLVGGLGAIGWQRFAQRSPTSDLPPAEPSGETLSPTAPPPTGSATSRRTPTVGDYLQIQSLPDPTAAATMLDTEALPVPPLPEAVDIPERLLAVGTIVRVQSRQQTPDDQKWVRLQVCTLATNETATSAIADESPAAPDSPEVTAESNQDRPWPVAQPGDQGWLLEADLPLFAAPLPRESRPSAGDCLE